MGSISSRGQKLKEPALQEHTDRWTGWHAEGIRASTSTHAGQQQKRLLLAITLGLGTLCTREGTACKSRARDHFQILGTFRRK
jgi:hypothetical protein